MGSLTNSDAAFHQGLHCLLRINNLQGQKYIIMQKCSTCDPVKYTMGTPILIVPICMEKSIRKQRVNFACFR